MQAYYQILSIIFLKEFIKLNANMDTMTQNVKLKELSINIANDLIEYKYLCCSKNYQQKFDEKLKEQFFNTYNSLAMITISLYLKKKIFTFT